ncbi:MAG: hypothetical protein WAZ94_07280 [Phycisphaerales bacterium]
MNHKVTLGRTVITAAALHELNPGDVLTALARHASGDWGDVCPADREVNNDALLVGDRLLSVYHDRSSTKFWIITEWDRSATTVLLPEDY